MKFVLIALLSLYVIAFIVFLWKSAAVWRWYQILMAVIVMGLVITFLAPLAGVVKTRAAWNKMFMDVEKQRDQLQVQYQELLNEDGGIRDLQLELQNLRNETGRVFRHFQMDNVTPQGITLSLPQDQAGVIDPALGGGADPAAPAAAGGNDPLLDDSTILYAFAEQEVTLGTESRLTPTLYLGEFSVVSSTPNEIVVKATGTPSAKQRQAIESGAASRWSMYEVLPVDGHEPFLAEGSSPDDTNMLGRVDTDLIQQLFGNRLRPETLDAYLKDGQRAGEGSDMVRDDATAEDGDPAGQARNEQLNQWAKIKFIKAYSETVDSSDARKAEDGTYFDMGLAVDSRLRRKDPVVKFKAGDEIYVTAEQAIKLRDQKDAEIIANYNVRDLNDYRFILRRTDLRLDEVQDQIAAMTRQKSILEATMAMTDAMNQKYQVDKSKLEADSGQIIKERAAIAAYTAKLDNEIKNTKQQLISLYRSNLQLNAQLKAIHAQMSREIDERTQAAAP